MQTPFNSFFLLCYEVYVIALKYSIKDAINSLALQLVDIICFVMTSAYRVHKTTYRESAAFIRLQCTFRGSNLIQVDSQPVPTTVAVILEQVMAVP